MERIIIREEDNTFNVETLSSYDVAYVPGFGFSDTLFRTPTLITSKYQFLQTFGASDSDSSTTRSTDPPVFPSTQYYPLATETQDGFPTYAIPGYSNLILDSAAIDITNFDDIETLQYYYTAVEIEAPEAGEDWQPAEGLNYFLRTDNTSGTTTTYTMAYTTFPRAEGATYVDTYGPQSGQHVYRSLVSPEALNWFEYGESEIPYISNDDQIGVEGTTIKNYYQAENTPTAMFNAGDADPGFRYALYLLSLGMPIYYEQMNSRTEEEVDLTTDFNSALAKYGTVVYDAEETSTVSDIYISPAERGWYYNRGTSTNPIWVRCTDETIQYRTVEDVGTATWYITAGVDIDSMYQGLRKRFMADPDVPDYSFDSMGDYSIKYITSGGYPTFEYGRLNDPDPQLGGLRTVTSGLASAMIHMASERKDSLALIDHTDNPERTIYSTDLSSVIRLSRKEFQNLPELESSYGAMFTPWYSCTHSAVSGENGSIENIFMPASLAYLSALATQVKNNQTPWLAVSGVSRGKIPYFGSLHTNYILTNNVADSYQTVPSDQVTDEFGLISINPITFIRQYGYCIWGNRTLRNNKKGTKATSFLNIRNVASDIKKAIYEASQQLLFEQNTEILWINFKSLITPLLETMVSNSVLSDYKLTKFNVDPDSGEPVPAYMVLANVQIRPINSVEVFDMTLQIENNQVEVAEEE